MSSEEANGPPEGRQALGVINFQFGFLNPEMNRIGIPVEVRGGQSAFIMRTTAPSSILVSPGIYFVSARLPAGQELFEVVMVPPNGNVSVKLTPREEDGAQRETDEVSYYLGLSNQTLIPTRTQARGARWSSPLSLPVRDAGGISEGEQSSAAAPTSNAIPFVPLEELGFELVEAGGGGAQSNDSVHTLLAEYARFQTDDEAVAPLETMGTPDPSPPPDPAVANGAAARLASYSATSIELSLRLFRGNPLKTQSWPLPVTELGMVSQDGKSLRLKPGGVNGISLLQVSQPGRPVLNIALPMSSDCGCEVVVTRVPYGANAGAPGDDVSVDVHLHNLKADAFLRYRAQGMMAEATQLLEDKYEDPVGAAVGAYGLLQLNRLGAFGEWARNLYA